MTDDSALYLALSSPIRRRIVEILAKQGPIDLKGLSKEVGLQQITARHHLTILENAGIIKTGDNHTGLPGRPRRVFEVINTYHDMALPKRQYLTLARHLITDLVETRDREAATEAMKRIGRRMAQELLAEARAAKGQEALVFSDLKEHVVPALDEFGAAPTTEEDGNVVEITFNNCVFLEIAEGFDGLTCAFHSEFVNAIAEELGLSTASHQPCNHDDSRCGKARLVK